MSNVILTDLSPEILHNLFFFVDATDLASLAGTCRFLRDFIRRDDLLWRRIYLSQFDDPRHSPESWALALQNLVHTEKLLQSSDYELKRTHWPFLSSQILPLLLSTTCARPNLNTGFLGSHFHHATRRSNASTLLRQSSLFRRCGTPNDIPADSVALRQLSARLHVYSALPLEVRETEFIDMPGTHYIHPYARSRLYDLRRYLPSNYWGPFMDDGSGRIDWEKVQAIYIVLGYGLRMLSERTGGTVSSGVGWGMGLTGGSDEEMWQGLGAGSYRSMTAKEVGRDEDAQSSAATTGSTVNGSESDDSDVPSLNWFYDRYDDRKEAEFQHQQAVFATQDPYGVKGTWMRIVNFLDYHDLFAFNFTGRRPPDEDEREPVETSEAFRLILLKLWVTSIEWPDEEEGQPEDWETIAGSEPCSPAASRDDTAEGEDGTASEQQMNDEQEIDPTPTPANNTPKKKSKYPIVHFAGRSRSLHIRWDPNANSHIRGSNPFYRIIGRVQAYPAPAIPKHELQNDADVMGPSDLSHIFPNRARQVHIPSYNFAEKVSSEVVTGIKPEDDLVIRWTTFSVFHGEERWRSEGVQIGGLKSARGILGNWFDKDFDQHGPAGPTGFWKMGDGVEMYGKRTGERRIWGEEDD